MTNGKSRMKRRRRDRGWLRWLGLALSVWLMGLWFGTQWYSITYQRYFFDGKYHLHWELDGGQLFARLSTYSENGVESLRGIELPSGFQMGWHKRPGRWVSWWRWNSKLGLTTSAGIPCGTWSGFSLALWITALVFAIPTAFVWYSWWRRRIPPGHCQRCGYDLRASKDRCPECGTGFSKFIGHGQR